MAIDFSQVTAITIPEGSVSQITDSSSNVLWSATPTTFTVHFTTLSNIGNTTTSTGSLKTNSNTWNEMNNVNNYNYIITNINRQISGELNRPYDAQISNSKFIQVNQLAFKNSTTTSRSNLYVRIYDYNLGASAGMIYDSRTEGDPTFNLPANTTDTVYLELSTKPQIQVTKTYAIEVYQYNGWMASYRAAKVLFSDYDIAPGDAS